MYRKLICLIGLMAIFAWSVSALAVPPALIDDFSSYANGQVDAVTTTWKGIVGSLGEPTATAITADSNSAYDKVMRVLCNGWGGTYGILSGDAIIANNTTKTLFMRLRASATTTDTSFGMTGKDVPLSNEWSVYGPQIRILSGNIQARDGIGWGVPLLPVAANTWYYVWVVVNHTANTFKVYINASGLTATETDRLGATSEYGFRINTAGQGRDANDMDRFMSMTGLNGGSTDWKLWVDDIYVADGTDLTARWRKWASYPNPADNSTYSGADVTLTWTQGRSVATNDVYFDTDLSKVTNASRTTPLGVLVSQDRDPNNYPITGLIPGTTYYWRIDEINGLPDSTVYKGKVWSFATQPLTAYNPGPPDGDILVDPNAILSWSPGFLAKTHDVNFGTTNPPPIVSPGQAGTTYDPYGPPPGKMLFNQLYYWQIKEVNDNPPGSWPGDVWSFTTWPNTPYTTDPCLAGWWKFEDSGGGKTLDSSGYNRHGTLMGDPNYTDGIFGDAIELDGINDWVSVGSVGISGAGPRTIAGWAKMNTTIGADIQFTNVFGFSASGNTTEHTCFNIDVAGTTVSPASWYIIHILNWQRNILPPDLDWHHLAATYDGTTVRWYGDGELKGEEIPTPSLTTIDNVQMGKRATSEDTFPGLIDDVRIYNRVLTLAEIRLIMSPPQACIPKPANNELEADKNPTLTWKPGCYTDVRPGHAGHKLYFSNDFNDVNERKPAAGPHILSDPCYTPPGPLPYPKTYYWRVDEVNVLHPDSPWPGNIWRFTVPIYKVVDNFELYITTGTQDLENPDNPLTTEGSRLLRRTWIDGLWNMGWTYPLPTTDIATSGSYVQLNTDPCDGTTNWVLYNKGNIALSPTRSMKFYYDNDGGISWVNDLRLPLGLNQSYLPCWNYTTPNYYSEASAAVYDAARPPFDPNNQDSLGMSRDWSGYKLLKLSYYGDPNNTIVATDKLYVGLKDGAGRLAFVTNPDQTYIQRLGWHDWYIPLSIGSGSFKAQNANLNLTDVNRIYIGFGIRGNTTTTGGKGAVFFDDIRLYPVSVCIQGTLAGDFNGDCKVDGNDLQRMTEVWLGQMPTPPTPVINLDASGLALSPPSLTNWPNTGSLGGSFVDFNTPQTGYRPKVQMVEGVKAVVFDSNDIMKATISAPASITGSNPFTIIYKVWNLDIGISDRVFTWAKRSSITGKFAGVGYGSNASYGAVSHGATATAADAPFDTGFGRGVPAAHTWHTIAITYPGCSPGGPNTVETVMVDGVVNSTEAKNLNIWPGCDMVIGGGYDGNSTAAPPLIGNPMNFLSGALAKLKVYSVAIPPRDLAILMGTTEWMGTPTPIDMKVDNVINFKDLALFANKWMQTNLFP